MDRGEEQAHGITGEKAVMRCIDGDRFRQNEPTTIALMPLRRDRLPETLARVGRFCRKLSMSGSCGRSLTIRCETQTRAPPRRKGGARCVFAFDTASGEKIAASGQWSVNPNGASFGEGVAIPPLGRWFSEGFPTPPFGRP